MLVAQALGPFAGFQNFAPPCLGGHRAVSSRAAASDRKLSAPGPVASLAAILTAAAAAGAAASTARRRRQLPSARFRWRPTARNASGGDEDAVVARFQEWLESSGITVSPNIAIVPDSSGIGRSLSDRRVVCQQAISPDEVMVLLPSSAVCSVAMAADCAPPDDMKALAGWWSRHTRTSIRLAAALVWQRERFGPYIDMLYKLEDIQAPWLWDESDFRFLPASLASSARARREALEAAWTDLEADGFGDRVPRELFFRAHHAAASRAFSGDSSVPGGQVMLAGAAALLAASTAAFSGSVSFELAAAGGAGAVAICTGFAAASGGGEMFSLLPMIDQINHASGAPPDLQYNPTRSRWELRAGRAYSPGDEIFFSYGPKDSDGLLLQHGFVQEDNADDAIQLPLPRDHALLSRGVQTLRFCRGGSVIALGEKAVVVEASASELESAASATLRAALDDDGEAALDEEAEIGFPRPSAMPSVFSGIHIALFHKMAPRTAARRSALVGALASAAAVATLQAASAAFLPVSKPMLRAGAMTAGAAAAGVAAAPAFAAEGFMNLGKTELGGGFAINGDIPETGIVNIAILVAGLVYLLGPILSESMSAREKEITTDIADAIAKFEEATARLAEAEKSQAQADQVVAEINASISKDQAEYEANMKAAAQANMERQAAAADRALEEMKSGAEQRVENFIQSEAVSRGLKEMASLKPDQQKKFMENVTFELPLQRDYVAKLAASRWKASRASTLFSSVNVQAYNGISAAAEATNCGEVASSRACGSSRDRWSTAAETFLAPDAQVYNYFAQDYALVSRRVEKVVDVGQWLSELLPWSAAEEEARQLLTQARPTWRTGGMFGPSDDVGLRRRFRAICAAAGGDEAGLVVLRKNLAVLYFGEGQIREAGDVLVRVMGRERALEVIRKNPGVLTIAPDSLEGSIPAISLVAEVMDVAFKNADASRALAGSVGLLVAVGLGKAMIDVVKLAVFGEA
ncbi:unnamed protein product [Polarella glacialis]|uniref:SET domain-containing protein n=1 Tax=Polarella glacialis TaxID=89957 RepID=A0A813IEH2_POLGL|nr:unnamed protein product [Polarella glacialis]